MAKVKSLYVCQQCGYQQSQWAGRCPQCGEWNSLVETIQNAGSHQQHHSPGMQAPAPIKLREVKAKTTKRISTKISELDRVLGGGLVPGQAVLLAGEPGIGKSTILLEVADKLGEAIYVAGEESASQIKIRADRLGLKAKNILIYEQTDVDVLLSSLQNLKKDELPNILIVDSIQTMKTSDLSGMAGSVGQVRETASRLTSFAKSKNIPLVLVGHATKEGSVAGPATLSHLVDTVCWFEGERELMIRMIRSIKNRFGPTDEIGLFRMEDKGLVSVTDAQKLFIAEGRTKASGSAITCIMEGTRPVLVEIQSLVVPTHTAYPRRIAQGIDSKRLEVMLAVIIQRLKMPFWQKDVFVNVVGGANIKEPAADLALVMSLVSAFKDQSLGNKVFIGEVGLSGEVREVIAQKRRVKYAKDQGFVKIMTAKEIGYINNKLSTIFTSQK